MKLAQIWPQADKLLQKGGHIPSDEEANCVIPWQILKRKVCYMQLGQFPSDHDLVE
jgi:hypothetical protein